MRQTWTRYAMYVAGAICVLFLLLAPRLLNAFFLRVLSEALIFAILAISVDILVGYTGLAPLGHAGFLGIAAYTVGYLTVRAGVPHLQAILLALGLGLLVSFLFGVFAVRTSGIYFLMITLAEGMIIWGLAYRWAAVTGAENGIRGISRPPFLQAYSLYYYAVLVALVLAVLAAFTFVHSPFGMTLQGIRENERRMRTLGYNVGLHKLIGFTVSGFLASVAGVLYVYHNNFVSPSAVEFSTSAEALLMVILGGSGTIIGPVIGSFIVTFSRHILSLFTDRWLIVLGTIFVFTIMFAPHGIVGEVRRRRRLGASPAEEETAVPAPAQVRGWEATGITGEGANQS